LEHYARSFEQEVEAINDPTRADDTVFVSLYGVDIATAEPVIVQETRVRSPAQVVNVGLPVIEDPAFAASAQRVVEVLELPAGARTD
jgi:hypothetical protein